MNIHTLPLGSYQTNCYLVYGDGSDSCVVIDPGFDPQTVLLETKKLGKSIAAIFLTHGHFDHVGGVKQLAADTDCPVYICQEDLNLPAQLTSGKIYHTHTYDEGDRVELAGVSFRVLRTPGHTEGSVCLLAEDALFSGDTLFAGTCGRTDLPGGSWSKMQSSMAKLRQLEGDLKVYPGHGGASTLDIEKKFNPYMQ